MSGVDPAMHGRLEDCRHERTREDDAQSTLIMSIEADAATPDQMRAFLLHLPKGAAFVVRRGPKGGHEPILAALVAGGAIYRELLGAEEPIRPGCVYLVGDEMSFSRRAGKLVIHRALEGRVTDDQVETHCPTLTMRQREVLDMVVAGAASKRIAAYLRISQRTVDNHRAAIMRRLGARSLAELVRISVSG